MKTVIAIVRPQFVRSLLLAVALFGATLTSSASVFVSVAFAPPPLPVYVQPICPGPEYIWVPGYWAYGSYGYYWVPGTWVLAPFVGALWTPGYWGWSNAVYVWHSGYWGPRVGFYGGIDYGFGYFGVGYLGGYWNGGSFYYNTAVTNVNVNVVRTTYSRPVAQNASVTHVSFNGPGGMNARPTAEERLAARETHRAATPLQVRHERLASTNRALLASVNHGSPQLAATPRPATFGQARASTGAAGGAGNAPHVASSHTGRALQSEPNAPHAAPSHAGREHRADSNAAHVAPPHANREFRTEHGTPRANTGPSQVERMPAPERHAKTAPQIQSQPAPERHVERHVQSAPQFRAQEAPRVQSQPAPERHARAAPQIQSQPAPERHIQNAPQFRAQEAPRMQSQPAPERHAQNAPRMPAPEQHAQNAPRPQGQPHEGRGGDRHREESHGQ